MAKVEMIDEYAGQKVPCGVACYECPSFRPEGTPMNALGCATCPAKRKPHTLKSRVKEAIEVANRPEVEVGISGLSISRKFRNIGYAEEDWAKAAKVNGFKTDLEMFEAWYPKNARNLSSYRISKILGISDITIRKRLKYLGFEMKVKADYWGAAL